MKPPAMRFISIETTRLGTVKDERIDVEEVLSEEERLDCNLLTYMWRKYDLIKKYIELTLIVLKKHQSSVLFPPAPLFSAPSCPPPCSAQMLY